MFRFFGKFGFYYISPIIGPFIIINKSGTKAYISSAATLFLRISDQLLSSISNVIAVFPSISRNHLEKLNVWRLKKGKNVTTFGQTIPIFVILEENMTSNEILLQKSFESPLFRKLLITLISKESSFFKQKRNSKIHFGY